MIGEEIESTGFWNRKTIAIVLGFAVIFGSAIVIAVTNLSVNSVFHVTAPVQPANLVWTQSVASDVGTVQQGSTLAVPFAFKNSGGQALAVSCALTGAGAPLIMFNETCPSSLAPQQEFRDALIISVPSSQATGDYAFTLSVN